MCVPSTYESKLLTIRFTGRRARIVLLEQRVYRESYERQYRCHSAPGFPGALRKLENPLEQVRTAYMSFTCRIADSLLPAERYMA